MAVQKAEDPLEGVPPLTTTVVTSEDDKVEALHIIADTVAQQRQFASQAILFHPAVISTMVIIFGLIYQWLYKGARSDWALIGTTSAGTVMALLISIRGLTGGYIEEAEAVGTWKWLDKGRDAEAAGEIADDQDTILLSRFGEKPIGALVLRGVRDVARSTSGTGSGTRSRRQNSSGKNAPVTGMIRAFSVQNRYRRKGVGVELLEEAITVCQDKGWSGPEFAEDHALSKRVIPKMFHSSFAQREKKARAMLEKVKEESGVAAKGVKKGKR